MIDNERKKGDVKVFIRYMTGVTGMFFLLYFLRLIEVLEMAILYAVG